jgi:Ca2+/Na+ antiporter
LETILFTSWLFNVLFTAGLGGWYMTLRRRGDLSTQRTVRLLMVVMLVVVFGGRYLVRNW